MNSKKKDRKVYKQPAIVYEGKISTRAGSVPGASGRSADPANLFGDS